MTKNARTQFTTQQRTATEESRRNLLSRLARYARGRQVTVRLVQSDGGKSFHVHRIMESITSNRLGRPRVLQWVEGAARRLTITPTRRSQTALRPAIPVRTQQRGTKS